MKFKLKTETHIELKQKSGALMVQFYTHNAKSDKHGAVNGNEELIKDLNSKNDHKIFAAAETVAKMYGFELLPIDEQ